MVTICTSCFNVKKLCIPYRAYLYVPYGFRNKQPTFPKVNRFLYAMWTQCVFYDVGTECLNVNWRISLLFCHQVSPSLPQTYGLKTCPICCQYKRQQVVATLASQDECVSGRDQRLQRFCVMFSRHILWNSVRRLAMATEIICGE
jgi:hypothetical protein